MLRGNGSQGVDAVGEKDPDSSRTLGQGYSALEKLQSALFPADVYLVLNERAHDQNGELRLGNPPASPSLRASAEPPMKSTSAVTAGSSGAGRLTP